ncbi:hypothetical protein GGS20DRAFT_558351 [Poronia punctata]|nr:hypothetical protein GGS20DRAFT_558351 [Poronia punctata]
MATGAEDAQSTASVPRSPWAARYGVGGDWRYMNIINTGQIQHSGIAPMLPGLHPLYYADEPRPDSRIKPLDTAEVDLLFTSEYYGGVVLNCLKPWQLGPLNAFVDFGRHLIPTGHTQLTDKPAFHAAFRAEMIEVDESKWYPCFRKDRWYDDTCPDPQLQGRGWSVDIPEVWEHLRVSLEIANRIMAALIDEENEFIAALIWGHIALWSDLKQDIPALQDPPSPDALTLLSPRVFATLWARIHGSSAASANVAANPGAAGSQTQGTGFKAPGVIPVDLNTVPKAEWHKSFVEATRRQEWGLLTDPDVHSFYGVTVSRRETGVGFVCLTTRGLLQLMKGGLSLAEQCNAYFLQANTILHELAHAIGARKYFTKAPAHCSVPWPRATQYAEPFYNFQATSELGYAFINSAFGGVPREAPMNSADAAIPIALILKNWPFPNQTADQARLGTTRPGHPAFAPDAMIQLGAIPATYCAQFLSKSFWGDAAIKRKTDKHFHQNILFRSVTPNDPDRQHLNDFTLDEAAYLDLVRNDALDSNSRYMFDVWNKRNALWNQARHGWHEAELMRWGVWMYKRQCIERFRHEFDKGPSEQGRDLYLLAGLADDVTGAFDSTKPLDEYVREIRACSSSWYFHVIGLLMQAALPIRRERHDRMEESMYNIVLKPSAAAAAANHQPYAFQLGPPGSRVVVMEQSFLSDPFTSPNPKPVELIEHSDYLNQALRVIEAVALELDQRSIAVFTPWVNEILRVEHNLRIQRLAQPAEVRRTMCAQWDFNVPPYSPTDISMWKQDTREWVRCRYRIIVHDPPARPANP